MGRGLKAAIAVELVVLAAALVFSFAFFQLKLYRATQAPVVALIVLWVLVAAVLLFVFWARSLQREEMIRRFYLNKDWIYNHEIGYAPIAKVVPDGDEFELVTFAADSLAQMSYGFEVADPPEGFTPDFLVTSTTFAYHKPPAEEGAEDDAEDDDRGVIIDRWAGTLLRADEGADTGDDEGFVEVGKFENARELAELLQNASALE